MISREKKLPTESEKHLFPLLDKDYYLRNIKNDKNYTEPSKQIEMANKSFLKSLAIKEI